MKISIGIITSDNENKINTLLASIKKQVLKNITIDEIIIISINKLNIEPDLKPKIKIIYEKKRNGKYYAINSFLKKTRNKITILCSGDIILENNFLELICKPFHSKTIGIVGAHPIPIEIKKTFISRVNKYIWDLHHLVSLVEPKVGEAIAFRNTGFLLPNTSVDEEMIANILIKQGFSKYYAKKAIIYNIPPTSISQYINQRVRYFSGHLFLRKKYNYSAVSLNTVVVLKKLIQNLIISQDKSIIFIAILFEIYSRILGYFIYLFKKEMIIWKVWDN